MLSRDQKAVTQCLWTFLFIGAALPSLAADGFGSIFNKDFAVINRVHPPKVFLSGTRIAIRATASSAEDKAVVERLKALLESEVLGADPRLTSATDSPQTIIEVTVVQNDYSEKWETRTVIKSRQTGKDDKGKAIYQSYEDQVKYKIVGHNFGAAHKVYDARTKANLDADTFTLKYSKDFQEGQGAPDKSSLEGTAIQSAVEFVRARLTPSKEQVGTLLPRGSLKGFANLATAGLWPQYLEALQMLPARPKLEDESYRLYGIGLAHEALGYASETSDETLRYLQQAAVYYNQALAANPGEKYFSLPYERKAFNAANLLNPGSGLVRSDSYPAPLQRVRASLVDYQRLKEFESAPETGAKTLLASGEAPASEAEEAIDNGDIIEMVQAGLAEEIILTAINTAAEHRFDVTPKGLIELSKAKVSKKIIHQVQTKAGQP